jgi:hypothetical protein
MSQLLGRNGMYIVCDLLRNKSDAIVKVSMIEGHFKYNMKFI